MTGNRMAVRGRMLRQTRIALAIGLAVGLALAGTGIASASWNTTIDSSGSVTAATASTGPLGGVSALNSIVYRATGTGTVTVATLTLTDSGVTPLAFALGGSFTGSSALAALITLSTWAQVAGSCGSSIPTSGVSAAPLTSATFTLPAVAQSAVAAATVTLCAATTLSASATIVAQQGLSVTETLTMSGAVGNWTTASSSVFTQSVYQVGNPTAPVCKQMNTPYLVVLTQQDAIISWTTPSVPSGTVSYTIVDATTLVAVPGVTVSGTSANFVNGNLNAATENLLVRAKDSALGTTSPGLAFTLSQASGLLGLVAVAASCVSPAVTP